MTSTSSSSGPERRLSVVVTNGARSWGGNESDAVQFARKLQERGHRVKFLWRDPVVGDRVREADVPQRRLVLRGDLDAVGWAKLVGELRGARADAVILTKWREFLPGSLAARAAGVPLAVVRLGLRMTPRNDLKRRLVFRLADRVLVNAQEIKDGLAACPFVDPERVRVIVNGVDLTAFRPGGEGKELRREWAAGDSATVYGTVGALTGQKAHEDFVEAARAVSAERPDARFVVVGEGDRREALERRIDAAGLAGRFRLAGFRRDVPAVLAAFDVFVLSSINEGMARALQEACACGLPIVATDVSGTRACVEDGVNGFVVPPRDPAHLARRMREIAADPERLARMGAASRARAEADFDEETAIDRLERMLLEPRRPAGVRTTRSRARGGTG